MPTPQTQPSWDQVLPANERFVLAMGGAAVLDKETGLVWEQSPETNVARWSLARLVCPTQTVGGRKAWRLPSVHELANLVDQSNAFPAGFRMRDEQWSISFKPEIFYNHRSEE